MFGMWHKWMQASLVAFTALFSFVCDAAPNENIRALPYPFSHVVSFASDVDMQRPWHGAAIHRVFNEEIGLTISDSLWPHGAAASSSLFVGPHTINRTASGVGSHPVFALLLREWHRGNIDHFHSWQDDSVFQLRNEVSPPRAISGGRISVELPVVVDSLWNQKSRNIRLYFSAPPPADLSVLLHEKSGKSLFVAATPASREAHALAAGAKSGWFTEFIVPPDAINSMDAAMNLMQLARIEILAPNCAAPCDVNLVRIERDHFSRQTILSQARWLERWNIRPALLTSHGGFTLAQNFGIPGGSTEVPRSPGTIWADPAVLVKQEALADRVGSHAFHSDVLKRLSVLGVWSYFPAVGEHMFSPLATWKIPGRLPALTSSYAGLYDVPRSTIKIEGGIPTVEVFLERMKSLGISPPESTLRPLYCGPGCTMPQGDALAILLSQSIHLIDAGHKKILHFWYSHFGSGGSTFRSTSQDPVTPDVLTWMRRLANLVHNFDGSVNESRRVWSPPANSWLRYQILQAGIDSRLTVGGNGSSVVVSPWVDPVTGVSMPDMAAGSRDLHGVTVYVRDAGAASIRVGSRVVETVTRNPPDASGRESITVVDDNTPTSIIGGVSLRERGSVEVRDGNFVDVSGSNPHVTVRAGKTGKAELTFRPWALDLWNTSHLHLEYRIKQSPNNGVGPESGHVRIEMLMEDGGQISILDARAPPFLNDRSSTWRLTRLRSADGWQRHTLDVAQLNWPRAVPDSIKWSRPALPLGRVRELRVFFIGAGSGGTLEIRSMNALRPSGNGEAPDGGKLVSGRITVDGMVPLARVTVEAKSETGTVTRTTSDRDGYYFFYGRKRGEVLSIRAILGNLSCFPMQGRRVAILKNEAEVDIQASFCRQISAAFSKSAGYVAP